ncbi:ATP-binding protein [Magnetococcus sp. PR-3]|uniref:ATP-binding protein n=1 Tax=Magnetococcus sp. PR-3 TaxID=3120355 RepID=UPI002FCE1351
MTTIPFTKQLSFKLARVGVILAFVLGLILSGIQVYRDYQVEEHALDAHIQRILDVAMHPATRAVHILNADLAQEVVQGLLEYDFIQAATILDDLQMVLATQQRKGQQASPHRWLSRSFSGGLTKYRIPLNPVHTPLEKPGTLTVTVDRDIALVDFVDRAQFIIIGGILRNLLLVLLLFSTYHIILTRPLNQLAQAVGTMNPKRPKPLPIDPSHAEDELGLLTHTTNHYLANSRDHWNAQESLAENLQRAKEDAESASLSKTEFLTTMSHEIRTPMNAIIGMGDLLEESNLSHQQQRYLTTLKRAGIGLMALINSVLDLSKIEAGELALEKQAVDLKELANEVYDMMSDLAKTRGIELELTLDNHLPEAVLADGQRLRQILINLLDNAIKFTAVGGVTLSIEQRDHDHFFFAVSDTGVGIDPKNQQRIFEPFTQADSSATRQYGGTGLGLTICQRLIQGMESNIRLESELGQGSRFFFNLQLPSTKKRQKPAHQPHEHAGQIRHILLADDAEDNRFLIQAFLAKTGHTLVMVENGAQAVNKFKEESFDLVLMDIQMPVMDGVTAIRTIRNWEKEHHKQPIPIIALTAHAMKADMEQTQQAGCTLHLSKPVGKARLLEVIEQL